LRFLGTPTNRFRTVDLLRQGLAEIFSRHSLSTIILVVGSTAVLVGSVSLGELVSRGRMADVYDAHDGLLGRIVAIKVLASAFDRDGGLRRAVPPRARAAAHLS
jgi:hypothetical protein